MSAAGRKPIVKPDTRTPGRFTAKYWREDRSLAKGGRYQYSTHASEKAGWAWVKEQSANDALGIAAPSRRDRPSVADVLARWLEVGQASGSWSARTIALRSSAVRVRINPTLGPIDADDLNADDVERWMAKLLADGLHPRTINQTLGMLQAALNAAVRKRTIRWNPAAVVETLRLPDEGEYELIPDDAIGAIRDALPEPYQIAVDLALGAGLRLGEVLGLTWDRVDADAGTIRVDRQWHPHGAGARYGFADPKGGRARSVPVMPSLLAALAAHQLHQEPGTERVVAHRLTGAPLSEQSWHQDWSRAAAGVDGAWTLHDLRHAFGSRHANAGVPITTVAKWMGHKSTQTTQRYYLHAEAGVRPTLDLLASIPAERDAKGMQRDARRRLRAV